MALLNDLRQAIVDYPKDNCKLEIVDYSLVRDPAGGPVGSRLNVGEIFRFRVKVSNRGPLTMNGVIVRAYRTPHATVAREEASLPFNDAAESHPYNIDAYNSITTGYFWAQAVMKTINSVSVPIVGVQIAAWDATFDHLLTDTTGQGGSAALVREISESGD